ncbi:hypothetical protein GCM10023194_59620 [Planotetraspora phitsanulokensis]|uniref:Uncharacterized protein n=1 Tax=Planotetraspora phitsanulokensis TaxID=575192 RepID=A0A8J3U838_9ACTN|nr:hypothetical protein Pph01_54260 [Planotetraspora phitsanulokensis]
MHRAARRFFLITEHGRALRDWEWNVSDAYTPNHVSPIRLTEAGPARRRRRGGRRGDGAAVRRPPPLTGVSRPGRGCG